MNAAGESVSTVQERLGRIARAYGADATRISAFPTYLMVSMGRGEPATLEITMSLGTAPRLDQIAALELLVREAEGGRVEPLEGIRRLEEIRSLRPRFGPAASIAGYAVLAAGICLVLHPAWSEIAAAAVFGGIVGLLRLAGDRTPSLQVLLPVAAAFVVSALSALAVDLEIADPGLRAMVASLVVFLPGAALTTSVLELAGGEIVAGSSRLVAGAMQLALLAFGILAGIETVGVASPLVLDASGDVLGDWAPWLGVLVFALGVSVANSAPGRSFLGLLIVLYAAWCGQVVGNAVFGGYVSAFIGATVMTMVAYGVSRLPGAMPQHASFLPGYWLLVPGALGLIGLAELAGDPGGAGTQDLVATVVSLFAVAIGVLSGTLLLTSLRATRSGVERCVVWLQGRRWPRRGSRG